MKSVSSYNEKIVREGERNRERIFDYISKNGPVTADDTYKYLKSTSQMLSKHTIHIHLGSLLKEKRIFKNKKERTYVAADLDLGYITMFAKMMSDASGYMISPHLINPANSTNQFYLPATAINFMDVSIYKEFCSNIVGISPSLKFLHRLKDTNNSNSKLLKERYLFEFVNRIGAYITYLFIQSMQPIQMNMREKEDQQNLLRRSYISRRLLGMAINIQRMFEIFHGLLYNTDQIKRPYPKEPIFFEVNHEEYNELSTAFRNVYPGIYEGLENYWKEANNWWLVNTLESKERWLQRKIDCNHNWKQVHIFKLEGIYYHCKQCNNVVDDAELAKIKNQVTR
jgi:hypothetical protein